MRATKQVKKIVKELANRYSVIHHCLKDFKKRGEVELFKSYFWQCYELELTMRTIIKSLGRKHLIK
jgi:hypothetical protein